MPKTTLWKCHPMLSELGESTGNVCSLYMHKRRPGVSLNDCIVARRAICTRDSCFCVWNVSASSPIQFRIFASRSGENTKVALASISKCGAISTDLIDEIVIALHGRLPSPSTPTSSRVQSSIIYSEVNQQMTRVCTA